MPPTESDLPGDLIAAILLAATGGLLDAIDLGLICLCFLIGAITGAWAAPHLGNHALWLPEPLLLGVALHALRPTS